MKRMIAAVCVLTLAVILSVTGYFTLKAKVELISGVLEQAASYAQDRDIDSMTEQTQELERTWKKNHSMLSALLHHADMDELEVEMMSLYRSAEKQDFDEYIDTCRSCITQFEHILESEGPTWGNIF